MPLVSPPGAFFITAGRTKKRQSCFCSAYIQPVASRVQTASHYMLIASLKCRCTMQLMHLDARTSEKPYKCGITPLILQCNLREISSSHGL